MLAPERQRHILQELEVHEAVRVSELAVALRVSEMTVRRDIEGLDEAGLLTRIHGGARRIQQFSSVEPEFSDKFGRQREAKAAIASTALELIQPGMTISLSGGTTTHQLAELLGSTGGITIVTNSLKVAEAVHHVPLDRSEGNSVIITGGERTPSEALVGPIATASIKRLNTDICFMGVHGLHAVAGLTTPNLTEAETNRALVEGADQLVVLADHTKFGVRSMAEIVPLSQVDRLITDDNLPNNVRDRYGDLVESLVIAGSPSLDASAQEAVRSVPAG